jgi:hypothetical protein
LYPFCTAAFLLDFFLLSFEKKYYSEENINFRLYPSRTVPKTRDDFSQPVNWPKAISTRNHKGLSFFKKKKLGNAFGWENIAKPL